MNDPEGKSDVPDEARSHGEDLRAVSALVVEATRGVTAIVEEMHKTIASGPALLGKPLQRPVDAIAGVVYGGIQGVMRLVGDSLDRALQELTPLLGQSTPGPEREAFVAALNGVLGDTLAARGNPLAIVMSFRRGGRRLLLDQATLAATIPDATGKVLVLVHGSSMNDLQWTTSDHDHGAILAAQHGLTPVALHYNSGLHVADNGRTFSALLEALVTSWPVPVTELVLLCHSMGGLVSRSACELAERDGSTWRPLLRRMIFLGTPHHGAPLERGGNGIDVLLGLTPYSRPLSRLGKIRSAGVTDLRYGSIQSEDIPADRFAKGADPRTPTPLPDGVACFAVAATTASNVDDATSLPGDGLVPVDSALGRHPDPRFALQFSPSHTWIVPKSNHLDLLRNPAALAPLASLWPADG